MTLFIGMKSPATEFDTTAIDDAITMVAAQVAAERRNGLIPQQGPKLDVTFMLPGKVDIPPFEGMRMGGYNDDGQTLYFEAAVPEGMMSQQNAPLYVAAVLQDVVENAASFFDAGGVEFDLENWRQAINSITQAEKTVH